MAQASSASTCSVFDPRAEMLLPDSFLFQQERNWLVDGQTAQCSDNNFGNVAIFSKRKIRRGSNTSFLLTISCSKSLERCVIGLADDDFRRSNNDMRSQSQYGMFEFTPGNELLGRARSSFNIGVGLDGETYVGGARTQEKKPCSLPTKKIRVRVSIGHNELRVIAPDIWGERHVVETIRATNELRLVICAPQGFSFKLEEIQERFTLKEESVHGFNVDLPDEYLEKWCKKRYKKIVKKIRKATSPTDSTITTNINIVVVGAFGAGKSSLINTLLTAFSGSVQNRPKSTAFVMNDSSGQGTRVIEPYELTPNMKLLDSIGMDAIDSTTPGKTNWGPVLKPLLRGEIGEGFRNEFLEVNTSSPAESALNGAKQGATESKQADEPLPGIITPESLDVHTVNHGVLLVGNPNMQEDFASIHNEIARLCGDMQMPIYGVITQLDRGVRDFSVKKLYSDPMLGELFDNARAMMTVHCFPVRCYTRQDQRQNVMYNWLAVEALDALFTQAVDYKRRLAEKLGVEIGIPNLDVESSDESDSD